MSAIKGQKPIKYNSEISKAITYLIRDCGYTLKGLTKQVFDPQHRIYAVKGYIKRYLPELLPLLK